MMGRIYRAIYSPGLASALSLVALIAVLIAALDNTAAAFATVKPGAPPWLLYLAAGAVELGVIALGLARGVAAMAGRPARRLLAGVLLFVLVSSLANYDTALGALLAGEPVTWPALLALDRWTLGKAAALGAALPIMALLMIETLRELAAAGAALERDSLPSKHPPSPAPASGSVAPRAIPGAAAVANGRPPDPDPTTDPEPEVPPERGSPADLAALVEADPDARPADLARLLGVSRPTVYAWAKRIGASRDDGRWRLQGAG